jgi:hypothetical protein
MEHSGIADFLPIFYQKAAAELAAPALAFQGLQSDVQSTLEVFRKYQWPLSTLKELFEAAQGELGHGTYGSVRECSYNGLQLAVKVSQVRQLCLSAGFEHPSQLQPTTVLKPSCDVWLLAAVVPWQRAVYRLPSILEKDGPSTGMGDHLAMALNDLTDLELQAAPLAYAFEYVKDLQKVGSATQQ